MSTRSTNELYNEEIERLSIESGMPALFLRRAHVLRREGKYEEAILQVKEGLQKFPGNPAAYYFLIQLFLDLKKPRQAEITLNSASKFFSVNELTAWYRDLISESESETMNSARAEAGLLSRYSITDDTRDEEPPIEEETTTTDDEIEAEEFDRVEPEDLQGDETGFEEDSMSHVIPEFTSEIEVVTEKEPEEVPDHVEVFNEFHDEPDSEIVTAGMAIIHARQGNTAKAIEIFTKLMEKEPEKRENYSKIIELLNNKITNH